MISTICWVIAIAALINAARLKINQIKAERVLIIGTLSRLPK